jgi:Flp pilus assembly protein TadD/predicted nucleic acid-binding Zn ribbon protein
MTQTLLEQGIGAALHGRRDEARTILAQVVEADETNEQAWLWLAGLVTDPEEMRTCLENVLHLNPDNAKAREGLAWVEQRYGRRATAETGQPEPTPEPQSKEALTAMLAETPRVVQPAEPPPPEQPEPAPAAATSAASAPGPAADEPPPTFPCVYCGAQLTLDRRSCSKCHNSLMIRANPREKRSIALTIIGFLWLISGVLQILGGLASTVMGALAFTTIQSQFARANRPSPPFPIQTLVPLVAGIIAGGLIIAIARGLLKRRRWTYIVVTVLNVAGVLGTLAMLVLGAAVAPRIAQMLSSPALASRSGGSPEAAIAIGALMTSIVVSLGVQLLFVLLTALTHRDFYGPMMRFQPELDTGSDMDNYNSGVAYKRRGMWFMATQEWEAAVQKKPRDPGYLHALGLAYVQLKQYDRARDTLDAALKLTPDDAQLQASRAAVDQLDKHGKKR